MRSKCREALIQLLVELRPSWGAEGIRACVEDPKLAMTHEGRIALVFVRAALDGKIRTPGGVLQAGPHWDEPGGTTPLPLRWKPERPPLSDDEIEAAAIAAKAAKAALDQAKGAVWCHSCNTSIPRDQVAAHDCGLVEARKETVQ